MTYIQIFAPYEDLEEIESLSKEVFRTNDIIAKTKISQYRADSIEASQLPAIFSATFSGVIAIVQIINLVLNLQDRKSKTAIQSSPISVKINTSNGRELDLNISGIMTNQEIKENLDSVKTFVDEFLRNDDDLSLRNFQIEESLDLQNIEKINLLFKNLSNNLTNIRELRHLPPNDHGETVYFNSFNSTFDKVNLRKFIHESRESEIYLHSEEARSCQDLFYILERENILAFHKISDDFRVDIKTIFVRYELEELLLFKKIAHHKNFILNNTKENNS